MDKLPLDLIASWTDGTVEGAAFVDGVQVDSRLIERGDLFVCLIGDKVNGHFFIEQAKENGAHAVLVSEPGNYPLPSILVEDTLEAMTHMAKSYRETLNACFIGVTGSNGKTSVKDALLAVCERVGATIATKENMNTEIGAMLNLFRMQQDTRFGIFEMGLDIRNDIQILSDLIQPHAGIVTSLAPAHLMNFDSVEEIAYEKMALLRGLKDESLGFYQGDFEPYVDLADGKYTSFGFEMSNDIVVESVDVQKDGVDFDIAGTTWHTNMLGRHQASNAAGVIACLRRLDIDDDIISEGLKHVALTQFRNQIIEYRDATILMDAYKSNPDSLYYALDVFSKLDAQRPKVVVLSEMVEMGAESERYHREVLERVLALEGLSALYVIGEGFTNLINNNEKNHAKVQTFDTIESLTNAVHQVLETPVVIMLKGARSYALERVLKGVCL